MESIVIGTAGHIDHGKTSLVMALTGQDTDTLAEEKRRGITINLGFSYFTLPNGKIAGIVDVPGHERFIKNMLAGASGIDVAMIVIAANEGVMPQTREHIDILSYMNIKQSVIVFTKIDMVDEEFKALVLDDTREYLQSTFLKDAPIFEVDSLGAKGIKALISHLDAVSSGLDVRNKNGDARMNIDRVFTVKGYGTVVTGTLADGSVYVDDEMTIYPEKIPTKIRGLQIHEQDVSKAHAGQRTAMNLSGLATNQICRGNVIAKSESVFVTDVLDVHFSLTASTKIVVKKMFECKLYLGSKELMAKIVPLGCRQVTAGQQAYGQILLELQAVVRRGDNFVLRTVSPAETIGGGKVIDPNVKRYKKVDEAILEALSIKHTGAIEQALEVFIKEHPFSTASQLCRMMNVESISAQLDLLIGKKQIKCLNDLYLHKTLLKVVESTFSDLLNQYHKDYPLRSGMTKAELQSGQTLIHVEKEFELLLKWLNAENIIHIEQGIISSRDFSPAFSSRHKELRQQMEDDIQAAGYTLSTLQTLVGNSTEKRQVMETILQDGYMLIDSQFIISKPLYQQAMEAAVQLNKEHGAVKLSDFRDRIGTTRKYALILLERFDKDKFTKRKGEDRILL